MTTTSPTSRMQALVEDARCHKWDITIEYGHGRMPKKEFFSKAVLLSPRGWPIASATWPREAGTPVDDMLYFCYFDDWSRKEQYVLVNLKNPNIVDVRFSASK